MQYNFLQFSKILGRSPHYSFLYSPDMDLFREIKNFIFSKIIYLLSSQKVVLYECWMGGRVVEGTGLENRQWGNPFEGSNPSPSAII